jgi:hypothetical protein
MLMALRLDLRYQLHVGSSSYWPQIITYSHDASGELTILPWRPGISHGVTVTGQFPGLYYWQSQRKEREDLGLQRTQTKHSS